MRKWSSYQQGLVRYVYVHIHVGYKVWSLVCECFAHDEGISVLLWQHVESSWLVGE